jgi:hypothetical protein
MVHGHLHFYPHHAIAASRGRSLRPRATYRSAILKASAVRLVLGLFVAALVTAHAAAQVVAPKSAAPAAGRRH